MNRHFVISTVFAIASQIVSCDRKPADAPPSILYGDAVCDQCNMIISDERWATATVIESSRGPEPKLFDDFNCQVNYEVENPNHAVLARWSHSHTTSKWIRTEEVHFVASPSIRSPMGSNFAAFASPDEAEPLLTETEGESMTFDSAWQHLGYPGSPVHSKKEAQNDT